MRPATLTELALLARVLVRAEPKDRFALAARILTEVEVASANLQSSGRSDPMFGDGSLMSRCLALSPVSEPLATDPDFMSAMIIACNALRNHSKS
jgi:hypothetical protein